MKIRLAVPLIIVVGLGWAGCSQESEPTPQPTNETTSSNPLTAPVDYIGTVGKAYSKTRQSTTLLSLQQAIKMFESQEGRLPKNLNELVGDDYLPRLPDPPPTMKFNYNPKTGEVTLVKQ